MFIKCLPCLLNPIKPGKSEVRWSCKESQVGQLRQVIIIRSVF